MKIIKYKPEFQAFFERLNKAWIEKYFEVEPMDEALLSNPEENILNKGGQIYFVEYKEEIIGTVALLNRGEGIYELAKMAVDGGFQGLGAGKLLCRTAIEEAENLNADKVVLFTHSRMERAIGIYRDFGFREVRLNEQDYRRADTKMELLLKPQTPVNWFDRKFDFSLGTEIFPDLLARLKQSLSKLHEITRGISEEELNYKPGGKWSVKEHIGHLWILESLWQKRFLEIKENCGAMSAADLNNTATDRASFNQYPIRKISNDFEQERIGTLKLLSSFEEKDLTHSLFHPRLNQPMRIIDLMYFVAEHDQHHLNAVREILNRWPHY